MLVNRGASTVCWSNIFRDIRARSCHRTEAMRGGDRIVADFGENTIRASYFVE